MSEVCLNQTLVIWGLCIWTLVVYYFGYMSRYLKEFSKEEK